MPRLSLAVFGSLALGACASEPTTPEELPVSDNNESGLVSSYADALDVRSGALAGDFGALALDEPMSGEVEGHDYGGWVTVTVTARGPSRYGLALLSIYEDGGLDAIPVGTSRTFAPYEAGVMGCTGVTFGNWDIDSDAYQIDVTAEADPFDPTVVHYTFDGYFYEDDETVLSGSFSMVRP